MTRKRMCYGYDVTVRFGSKENADKLKKHLESQAYAVRMKAITYKEL